MPFESRPKPSWQRSLTDAADRVEQELRKLVKSVDDEVVPEVRRHGSSALRTLAEQIGKLAQEMDDAHRDNSHSHEDMK